MSYETEKIHVKHEWIDIIMNENDAEPVMPSLFITAETVTRNISLSSLRLLTRNPSFWMFYPEK